MAKKDDEEIVHSSQLDKRMRRGDDEATPKDQGLRIAVIVLTLAGFVASMLAFVGTVGIGPGASLGLQSMFIGMGGIAVTSAALVFTLVNWRALRGHGGAKILDRAKADLQLIITSIFALFTMGFIIFLELGALLVFTGVLSVEGSVLGQADTYILFQTMILQVYILAIVMRVLNPTRYQPPRIDVIASRIVTPVSLVLMVLGILFALNVPQSLGVATQFLPRQAIHLLTMGIGLEFIAMRIRLRLPSIGSLFSGAVETARRANPDVAEQLRKKARVTYIAAFVFVAISMAFAAFVGTGAINIGSGRMATSLAIFYGGTAVIIMGLVAVRIFQSPYLRTGLTEEDELERLVKRRRKTPQQVFRQSVYITTGTVSVIFLVAAIATFRELAPIPKTYATDIFLLALIFAGGPYGWFFNQDLKRIQAMDEKFPDLLRDVAESARAGMTLTRALVTASKGTYGALTPEIQKMAAQVEWGVDFGDALQRFADRVKTPLIDRTVALVVQAQRAGGNVVDVLTAASDDAREIKQIVQERNEQMTMYQVVVYIAFFVFIAVVMVLSAQFIPAFKDAVGAAAGQSVGGFNFKDFEVEDFNMLFFHAAIIQAIGGGLVGGVLTKGEPQAGFTAIAIMIGISWVSFRVVLSLMTGGA